MFALDAVCPLTYHHRRLSNRRRQPLSQDTVCAKREYHRLVHCWLLSGSDEDHMAHRQYCRHLESQLTVKRLELINSWKRDISDFNGFGIIDLSQLSTGTDKIA